VLGVLTSSVVELLLSDFESQANDSGAWQAQAQLSGIFKVKGAVENSVRDGWMEIGSGSINPLIHA